MKINKGVFGLAIAVAGAVGLSQAPAVFANQGVNEHTPIDVSTVAISEATATATALARATTEGLLDGVVKNAHLTKDHGVATWKIRVLSGDGLKRGKFRIDATTGLVLSFKIKSVGTHHLGDVAKLEKEKLHMAERAHKLELKKQHMEQRGQGSRR